jgi:hypothetical protein
MTMSRISTFVTVALLATALPLQAQQQADLDAEARGLVKSFFKALKGELVGALESGGPVEAIAVCNERAPALAEETAADSGWRVARTSLKLRNPDNAPDAWESAVLRNAAASRMATAVVSQERSEVGERRKFSEGSEVCDSPSSRNQRSHSSHMPSSRSRHPRRAWLLISDGPVGLPALLRRTSATTTSRRENMP